MQAWLPPGVARSARGDAIAKAMVGAALFAAVMAFEWRVMHRGFVVFDYSLYIDGAYRVLRGERWNIDFYSTWGPVPNHVQAVLFRWFGIERGLFAALVVIKLLVVAAFLLGPGRGLALRIWAPAFLVVLLAAGGAIAFPWVDSFSLSLSVLALVLADSSLGTLPRGARAIRAACAGVLCAMAFLCKINLGTAATVFVLGVLLARARKLDAPAMAALAFSVTALSVLKSTGGASRWLSMVFNPEMELTHRVWNLLRPTPGMLVLDWPGAPSILTGTLVLLAYAFYADGRDRRIDRVIMPCVLLVLTHVATTTGAATPPCYEMPSGMAFAYALGAAWQTRASSPLGLRRVVAPLAAVLAFAWILGVVRHGYDRRILDYDPANRSLTADLGATLGPSWVTGPRVATDLAEGAAWIRANTSPDDRIAALPTPSVLHALTGRLGVRRVPLWWHWKNTYAPSTAGLLAEEIREQAPAAVLLRRHETVGVSRERFYMRQVGLLEVLEERYRRVEGPAGFEIWVLKQ